MPVIQNANATLRPDIAAALREFDIPGATSKFIGETILPIWRSGRKNGEYGVWERENVLLTPETLRTPGTGYNRLDTRIDSRTFLCEDRGLETPVDDSQERQYGSYLSILQAAARSRFFQMQMDHERRAAALIASITQSGQVTISWATIATATVLDDVDAMADSITDNSGAAKEDLSLIVSRQDFRYMRDNKLILDRIKFTNPGVSSANMTADVLAGLFGIKEIIVGSPAYNTAQKGAAISLSQVWPTGVAYLALLTTENAPLDTPCIGRTILWTEDSPTFPLVETYRDESVRSEIVRVRMHTDEILQQAVGDDLFVFKLNVVQP